MEASRFGFGPDTPPAFKFDPNDDDIVSYYLLPRALGFPNPYAHAIIEDDPGSVPPWELLRKYSDGNGKIDHAFFFGPPRDAAQNGGRKNRTIKGAGVWQGQKGHEGTVTLLHPGGGELDVTYKRYNLTFCRTKGGASTGYIMHEYEIISPPLPGTVLTRVKINKHPKKETAAAGEQPGTSYQYDAPALASNTKGFSFSDAQAGAPYGVNGCGMADAGCYYTRLKYAFPEDYCLPVTDQPGPNYNAAAMKSDSQGFTGAQADAFSGGGMVETDGAYYDPSQFVPVAGGAYNNYYCQYQEVAPWPHQLGQSHNHSQYLAGDAAVMCSHSEGFTFEQQAGALCGHAEDGAVMCSGREQQAGALCGYSDNGSIMRTESGRSTISLCDGGEENGDEIYDVLFGFGDQDGDCNCEMSDDEIYDVLFGDNDYFNYKKSDAGDAATDLE